MSHDGQGYMTDERRMIRDAAREFTMKEVLPVANQLDGPEGEIPMALRQKMADMGVTYSWLKRISVRMKPSSPGLTLGVPIRLDDRSVTQWRAIIFSARVMGRRPVARAGTFTFPWIRATLY